jgi:NAD(P)-dependent dehydrogenase (short-subunit alcohol dehydrogenase family)
VVGGTRGIGLEFCEALCRRGAHVITCGTSAEGVANVAAIASAREWPIEVVQADVRREMDLDALIALAVKHKGHLLTVPEFFLVAPQLWCAATGAAKMPDTGSSPNRLSE